MADRTSAALFASIFGYLAKKPDAMHDRGEEVEHADYFWTTECFNCGYCCSCEV